MNKENTQARSRVIGLDLHPSCFSASAFYGTSVQNAEKVWTHDKVDLPRLSSWAKRHLEPGTVTGWGRKSRSKKTQNSRNFHSGCFTPLSQRR
ncbi:MAG: hypothetical protein ACO3N7_02400 [Kiritimatiellia bacterium]